MRVDEIMSRSVISVAPTATVGDALDLFLARRIHHLLVIDRNRVVGVVSVRELSGKDRGLLVAEIMNRDVKTAAPTATLKEAASLMIGRNSGCVPIVDAGRVAGIITTSDLMRVLSSEGSRNVTV